MPPLNVFETKNRALIAVVKEEVADEHAYAVCSVGSKTFRLGNIRNPSGVIFNSFCEATTKLPMDTHLPSSCSEDCVMACQSETNVREIRSTKRPRYSISISVS